MVSDSIGGVASGEEMAADGGLGSGLVLVWDSPLDLYLGFERAIAISLITVERCWLVLWEMRSDFGFGVKDYNCCSSAFWKCVCKWESEVKESDKLRDRVRLKPCQQSGLVSELHIDCAKGVNCSKIYFE